MARGECRSPRPKRLLQDLIDHPDDAAVASGRRRLIEVQNLSAMVVLGVVCRVLLDLLELLGLRCELADGPVRAVQAFN